MFASSSEGTVGNPQLGTLRNNGGPTDTRAILSRSSPAVDNGDPQLCSVSSTDQRYAAVVGTCDIGAFEFGGKPPAPSLPPPIPGKHGTGNASVKSGTVRVKLPGSDTFFELKQGQQVPVGTTFDTSKGQVALVTAANKTGKNQKGWFYSGVFKFGQTGGKRPTTKLKLAGKLACAKSSGLASASAKKKRKRRLWGRAKGRFRTDGRFSAATVAGTKWLVEDRCNGTLTKVRTGVVRVLVYKGHKTIIVKAGHQYFAKR
jgi:hypothetical protein